MFRFVINDSILIKLSKFTGPLWIEKLTFIRSVLMTLHEGGSSFSNKISNEYLKKKRYMTYISSKGENVKTIYITLYTTKR